MSIFLAKNLFPCYFLNLNIYNIDYLIYDQIKKVD